MRIGIDARFYGSVGKGLGRYVQKLIENLEKIDKENQYFIFLRKENFNEFVPKNKNFKKVLADYRWYTFSEQINMPRILYRHKLDLVHFPHFNVPVFYRKKFIITIHDLILLHFPTLRATGLNPVFYGCKYLAYKLVIGSAIRRSKKVITVSNFSKEDILRNYSFLKQEKVGVTYEACDSLADENKEIENREDVLKKYDIIKPYLLYVGNAYPHKNLEGLLEAWKIFAEKELETRLVLVGKEDYFYRRLKEKIKDEKIARVVLAGFVKDADLIYIYRQASVYIFPSLYEGFGLPPLEAMSLGVPVISNSHGCMREVLGEAAYYFNGQDKNSIKEAIEKLLRDSVLRARLISRGHEKVREYSWAKMVDQTLEIYKQA
ncbi:MAG: glycosyltransferase family 1 protein [Candidatus Moraniibacteriota bacterium]